MIKLTRHKPQISYLAYPDFDQDPHRSLKGYLVLALQGRKVRYRDYAESENPPILHRKELFVGVDYPLRERFNRLSQQDERWGLYEHPARIGTRRGWETGLEVRGATLRGHRLVRRT